MTAAGPFETEQDARESGAVRAVYAAYDDGPGAGRMAPLNHKMLCEAISAARVELGAYDHRIVQRLSRWEPQTCAVITGLILAQLRPGRPPLHGG
jgi:hypothetical protein